MRPPESDANSKSYKKLPRVKRQEKFPTRKRTVKIRPASIPSRLDQSTLTQCDFFSKPDLPYDVNGESSNGDNEFDEPRPTKRRKKDRAQKQKQVTLTQIEPWFVKQGDGYQGVIDSDGEQHEKVRAFPSLVAVDPICVDTVQHPAKQLSVELDGADPTKSKPTRFAGQEPENADPAKQVTTPQKKWAEEVPSSQTPPSISFSTRVNDWDEALVSPLRERSHNIVRISANSPVDLYSRAITGKKSPSAGLLVRHRNISPALSSKTDRRPSVVTEDEHDLTAQVRVGPHGSGECISAIQESHDVESSMQHSNTTSIETQLVACNRPSQANYTQRTQNPATYDPAYDALARDAGRYGCTQRTVTAHFDHPVRAETSDTEDEEDLNRVWNSQSTPNKAGLAVITTLPNQSPVRERILPPRTMSREEIRSEASSVEDAETLPPTSSLASEGSARRFERPWDETANSPICIGQTRLKSRQLKAEPTPSKALQAEHSSSSKVTTTRGHEARPVLDRASETPRGCRVLPNCLVSPSAIILSSNRRQVAYDRPSFLSSPKHHESPILPESLLSSNNTLGSASGIKELDMLMDFSLPPPPRLNLGRK